MNIMMRSLVVLLVALFLAACAGSKNAAQQEPASDPRWSVIDSLERLGQFASALERTDTILAEAARSGDWRTEFKAWAYRSNYRALMGVDDGLTLMEIGDRAKSAPVPLAQLLHSLRAEGWWNKYSDDRWSIMERTELASGGGDDPETWTQGRYMAEVIAAYRASVEPVDTLASVPVGELHELLAGRDGAVALRPTLFDLLAHRAIEVFGNSETRLAEPAWHFTLNDPKNFTLFEPFAMRPIRHRDSTAWEFQALRLYQDLEKLHLVDDTIAAYVDVAMARLAYVHGHCTLPQRDSLHLAALELLRTRLPYDVCWSEVTTAIAQWHADAASKYDRLAGDTWKWERTRAVALCDSAIARWPSSYGARKARALKSRLEAPGFDLQCERAVPSGQAFRFMLQRTNVKHVWMRVVQNPFDDEDRVYGAERTKRLLALKPEREWDVELPDDGDLNEHMIELPVEGLPHGHYAILVSAVAAPELFTHPVTTCGFQVTDVATTSRQQGTELDLLVLDRMTGLPKPGVKVRASVRNPDHRGNERFITIAELTTDADGRVHTDLKGRQGEVRWHVEDGKDVFRGSSMWIYPQHDGRYDSLRTFLFTDRAIYRPGQEMHVKGIVTVQRGKGAVTKAAHRTTVYFHDVNGGMIDSLVVTTDAFGSFHGTFVAPLGRITGQMRISEAHGEKWIRVEEYKRPMFEAVFEPITTTPKLGEEATVHGLAKSYAGAPLDGAKVKYTVKRAARMPWWCGWEYRGLPWWRETEIANGETVCDAQGRFELRFNAGSSGEFPRMADPVFSFTVDAWVTDINGETQSAATSFVVGYRSIDLHTGVDGALDRSTADSLAAHVTNLNGERVDLPFNLKVTRLLRPAGGVKRERSWPRPDHFALTREDHAQMLPYDTYDNENDPSTWPRGSQVFARSGIIAGRSHIAFEGVKELEVGTYLLEMDAIDPMGAPVMATQVFTIHDPDIQNTGFESEAFHVQVMKGECEPGEKAVLLLSSALPACHVLMEVERDGAIVVSRPFTLRNGQQRVELPVLESDRGGFAVHFACVARGREYNRSAHIDVPWSNKQLKAEWMSFRDKLLPGAKEEWRLKITGPKKEVVSAQVLAAMYDASLDVFERPEWRMDVWGHNSARRSWGQAEPFGVSQGHHNHVQHLLAPDSTRTYPRLGYTLAQQRTQYRFRALASPSFGGEADGDVRNFTITTGSAEDSGADEEESAQADQSPAALDPTAKPSVVSPPRTDFRETAFFFPDLLTDRDGNVVLRFTMPDALTRWNFMGLAHTKELKSVRFDRSTITQKPLMVMPNLPRFLRQGDRITLTAKINVIDGGVVDGTATLELFDPRTSASVNGAFRLANSSRKFTAAPGQSAVVSWELHVPEDLEAVAVRIIASGAGVSDGEERVLPILTDRVLVTESIPIAINKSGTRTFSLSNLLNSSNSTTLQHRSLTLEYTPNPAWYAVQALPYLMEFPHECAEQVFSRYYANHLATHIVQQRPAVRKVFAAWSKGAAGNESAFLSALEKNQELKSVLLEETPWVLNAKDEGERKRRIALFFDLNRMANEDATALKKLLDMQLPNGAWPWWSGMQPSRYITQHIVAGFGHLQQLGALDNDPDIDAWRMVKRAVDWMDEQVEQDHQRMLREFKGDTIPHPSAEDIHYLYARGCFPQYPLDRAKNSAISFILERAQHYWLHYGLQEQAMIAIALHRLGIEQVPELITTSLAQRATMSEELGMHWKDFRAGYRWNEFPTEMHALMIEAFELVARDREKVNALRQYLLKLKQTTDWKTTKATADACYALLLTGDDWLAPNTVPEITVGGQRLQTGPQEAGTGYFQRSWPGDEVKATMGKVTVTTTSDALQWGALHWQYLERMDKVRAHESPFSIRRQVMLNEATENGPRLIALDSARDLKAGDKITVRVELRTDRWLDHVHLKDLRAAGLEPVQALSGYEWKGGLGYYRSVRDAAVHFFLDRMAPGTYVFEYDLKVTHAGTFSNGITNAQCMYAPEFSSHSEGLIIEVGE